MTSKKINKQTSNNGTDRNGVGKTMLLKNLARHALLRGHTVRFTTASDMLNDLAVPDTSVALTRRLQRYCRPQLLCCDEVGYLCDAVVQRRAGIMHVVALSAYRPRLSPNRRAMVSTKFRSRSRDSAASASGKTGVAYRTIVEEERMNTHRGVWIAIACGGLLLAGLSGGAGCSSDTSPGPGSGGSSSSSTGTGAGGGCQLPCSECQCTCAGVQVQTAFDGACTELHTMECDPGASSGGGGGSAGGGGAGGAAPLFTNCTDLGMGCCM